VAKYEIRWSKQVRKELDRLSQKTAERVYDHVGRLDDVPRPVAAIKLKGGSGGWRFRVGGYRVLYMIDDAGKMVSILAVQHRKDVYRDL